MASDHWHSAKSRIASIFCTNNLLVVVKGKVTRSARVSSGSNTRSIHNHVCMYRINRSVHQKLLSQKEMSSTQALGINASRVSI